MESSADTARQIGRMRLIHGALCVLLSFTFLFTLMLFLPFGLSLFPAEIERTYWAFMKVGLTHAAFSSVFVTVLVIDALAFTILLMGLTHWRIRERWFYRCLQISSVVAILHGPFGIAMAVLISRSLEAHEYEFFGEKNETRYCTSSIV